MSETDSTNNRSPLRASFDDSRSLIKYLIPLALLIVGVYYFLSHGSAPKPHSTALPTPTMVSPAGGANHIKKLDDLSTQQDKKAASDALKAGKSYAASLTGKDLPTPTIIHELGDTPSLSAPPAPAPETTKSPAPAQHTQPPPIVDPFTADADTRQERPNTPRYVPSPRPSGLSSQAEMELLAAWAGHQASIERVSSTTKTGTDHPIGHRQEVVEKTDDVTTTGTAGKARSQQSHGTMLLAAGRGVYGHSVITSNSDLGKEVLVEVDTGPFRQARISGTLTMQNNRLVIRFSSLMIGDQDPISVSAYAVSPETAETGVASEVNEHMATRIILPAAAAFVQGLGSAMMSANTSSYTGGYGMTAFTHLNLAQQMGAAAGNMGQEVGQLLQKQTPQTATVKLDKGDTIGILFDQPVYSP